MTQFAPDDLHQAMLGWFASHGLSVDATHYHFDRMFYAWRHIGERRSFTLWVSQAATEDYPPTTVLGMLRNFEPAGLMDKWRHAHLHVTSGEANLSTFARDRFAPDDA